MINLGDGNIRYFYGLMKQRRVSSFISKLVDPDGIEFSDPRVIENIFLNHFKGILAPQLEAVNSDLSHVTPFGRPS